MLQEHTEHFASSIVEFGRFLRTHGFNAGMRQTITALEAASAIKVSAREHLAFTLQSALCSTGEEWERFPPLFRQFWNESNPGPRSAASESNNQTKKNFEESQNNSPLFGDQGGNKSGSQDETGKAVYGASATQRLKKVDFSEVVTDDLAALEEISMRLLRRMSLKLSRRLSISDRACSVDLRRSIRRSIATGGEPFVLAYKARKSARNKIVLLIDVSGSMNFYSLFLVRFAYALQACSQRVETFLFSTSVVAITHLLRAGKLPDALRKLSQRSVGWSGGTRIGECLRQFDRLYGRKVLTRDTVFMILSDGWETGEPQVLANQMRVLRRRVYKILWLNPLLGLKDYQPLTRGMAAALPYVDVFAPAHNLESLLALEKHL